MIDLQQLLALLAKRLPWNAIETCITPLHSRKNLPDYSQHLLDLFGSHQQLVAAGVSAARCKRLSVRLRVSLPYLKYTYNESDEHLCECMSPEFDTKRRKLLIHKGHLISLATTTAVFSRF